MASAEALPPQTFEGPDMACVQVCNEPPDMTSYAAARGVSLPPSVIEPWAVKPTATRRPTPTSTPNPFPGTGEIAPYSCSSDLPCCLGPMEWYSQAAPVIRRKALEKNGLATSRNCWQFYTGDEIRIKGKDGITYLLRCSKDNKPNIPNWYVPQLPGTQWAGSSACVRDVTPTPPPSPTPTPFGCMGVGCATATPQTSALKGVVNCIFGIGALFSVGLGSREFARRRQYFGTSAKRKANQPLL